MGKAIPFFKKADLDASIGVFFDGFSKVIVAIAILAGTFGLDGRTIFGTMMPGVFLTVVILNIRPACRPAGIAVRFGSLRSAAIFLYRAKALRLG